MLADTCENGASCAQLTEIGMQPLDRSSKPVASPLTAAVEALPAAASVAPAAPAAVSDSVSSDKPRTLTFNIPLRPAVSTATTSSAGSVKTGGKLSASDAVLGVPMPAEAIEVLGRCFVKADGDYVVSSAQLDASKRALLAWFGFPADFVKTSFAQLKLDEVGKTGSALDANGRCTGTIAGQPFEGWVKSNDDWSKSAIASIVEHAKGPVAATSLTLSDTFFQRLGVSNANEQAALTQRLFQALSTWMTTTDSQIAWAKDVLVRGLGFEGTITLAPHAQGGSALAADQTITGELVEKDGKKTFHAILDSGVVVYGSGFTITSHKPKTP